MKSLILIGGGGHCKSAIDVIEADCGYSIVGITDQNEKIGKMISGYEIIAGDDELPELVKVHKHCLVTVGQLKSADLKKTLFQLAKKAGALLPVIASPHAIVSAHSTIGEGSLILHRAVINSHASVGVNCIINTGAIIEHDTTIGNHTHIGPGAVLNGHCTVGNRCMIGSGSVVIQQATIADNIVVGANSTVTKNLTEPGVYVGSPARKV